MFALRPPLTCSNTQEAYMALVPLPEEAESAVLEGDAQDSFAVEKEGASVTPLTQLLDKANATAPALDPGTY